MGESCGPAWVKADSGPLPENFNVVVRCLPDHTSLSCPDNPHPRPLPQGEREPGACSVLPAWPPSVIPAGC